MRLIAEKPVFMIFGSALQASKQHLAYWKEEQKTSPSNKLEGISFLEGRAKQATQICQREFLSFFFNNLLYEGFILSEKPSRGFSQFQLIKESYSDSNHISGKKEQRSNTQGQPLYPKKKKKDRSAPSYVSTKSSYCNTSKATQAA